MVLRAEGNAALFVFLQFGSRFANSFLTTAARYELLEQGGASRFASAQVLTSLARTVASQTAGLLTDNAPLRWTYVAVEFVNVLLAAAMLFSGGSNSLVAVNLCLGLSFAFGQPVTKSMPPAVVASQEDLAFINSCDLTCDKVARYLAPMVYAVISSSLGFKTAAFLCLVLYMVLALLRTQVRVAERKHPHQAKQRPGLLRQLRDGVLSLQRDSLLRLLILNTLVTNIFVYPVSSVVFPVLFKRLPEVPSGAAQSGIGAILEAVMKACGIRKAKAWMNYTALVSLGGVVGPFVSNVLTFVIELYSTRHDPVWQNWIGITFGMSGQLLGATLLAIAVSVSGGLDSGMLVLLLVCVWVLMVAVNNLVTTFFNSFSQERLAPGERGRYLANIMTVFTLGNSLGTLIFGWALSMEGPWPLGLIILGLVLRVALCLLLRRESGLTPVAPTQDTKKTD